MKGSITIFLAFSLSVLTGFILLLTGTAIRNAEKIRLEGTMDLGMNSILGEFHVGLHDRYGLLYIDLSYEGKTPSIHNAESRLEFYIRQNTEETDFGPWGSVSVEDVTVSQVKSAAFGYGNSMKYQAVCFMQDSGCQGKIHGEAFTAVLPFSGRDAMAEWSTLMGQIDDMELPKLINENGKPQEVLLGNPADVIYALSGNDLLYLTGIDISGVGVGRIAPDGYASARDLQNISYGETKEADTEVFIAYLFEKMGNYRYTREDSFLQYQLEYVAEGKASDYENLQAVTEKLLQWCFAKNVEYVMTNDALYGEALAIADSLQAVSLKQAFREPVAKSLLYAVAYLESLSEVRCLMKGGRIAMSMDSFFSDMKHVLTANIIEIPSEEGGYCYEEYLFAMILQLSEKERNLRSMDIMEMDIRMISNNPLFSMDFCVERLEAKLISGSLFLERVYGYY